MFNKTIDSILGKSTMSCLKTGHYRPITFLLFQIFSERCKISTAQTKTNGKTDIKRILMIDDELDITFTIKTTLENTGSFQVETFYEPGLALSTFKAGAYDLALLDIRMPE
jgi:PleD family two-component response regulator